MKTIKKFEIRSQRIAVCENKEIYSEQLSSPEIVAQVTRRLTTGLDQEKFFVFLLDVKNRILGFVESSSGSVDECPVDMRVAFRAAVHLSASGIIATHNHPSGDIQPSQADDNLTRRLISSGKLLGVTVLDHVVVSETGLFSYRLAERVSF